MSGREVNYGAFRVLIVPHVAKDEPPSVDAEGRSLGDDWLLASMGYFEEGGDGGDGFDAYVTTNRMHASEYDVPDADETAHILAEALQEWRKKKHAERAAARAQAQR